MAKAKTAKTAAQLDREIAAALIAGDAELEGKLDIGKRIRKQEGAKAGALLGYTESAKPVHAPARGQPPRIGATRGSGLSGLRKFSGWTWQDHEDAARLYKKAASMAGDLKLAKSLEGWRWAHAEMQEVLAENQLVAELKKRFRIDSKAWLPARAMPKADAERLFERVISKLGLNGKGYGVQGDNEELEVWNHHQNRRSPAALIILDTGEVRGP